ncbi:MAG: DUF1844 domain-containing protein [Acidobacteriota bacterium]
MSEVSFVAFVISMASNAAVHFGDLPEPQSGEKRAPNLEAASQIIDLLAMLEEKTRGNLTPEERRLLDEVLYDLRMRFVEARKTSRPTAEP